MERRDTIQSVRKIIWRYYTDCGRHALPWRKTRNPYRILVSEVMLQQTQVPRVIPKYREFLKQFPTVAHLARASQKDVLFVWSGLGYNRRARYLHQTAKIIMQTYGGTFPRTFAELVALPGIGEYTAGAVCAFAYNSPVPLLETNIRTVILHHFFSKKKKVTDAQVRSVVEQLLDRTRPREWYWASMDYGAHLKTQGIQLNNKSAHYKKQTSFKGSARELRGMLLRKLTGRTSGVTSTTLANSLHKKHEEVLEQLHALQKEELVRTVGGKWSV